VKSGATSLIRRDTGLSSKVNLDFFEVCCDWRWVS
jgi:hypothetical protein